MLGLVTSSNLIPIYIFGVWEISWTVFVSINWVLVYRPVAANACQKAFVTTRVGDFGLLLGIFKF